MGATLLFPTTEDLKNAIASYFESCITDEEIYDRDGNVIGVKKVQTEPYTMSGLAMALNVDRNTILNYEDRPEYTTIVRRARLKCENYAERSLFTGKNVVGAIFTLKNNYGWVDKKEIEQKTEHSVKLPTLDELPENTPWTDFVKLKYRKKVIEDLENLED